jgi:NADH-quinone oxidoreductase subunit I
VAGCPDRVLSLTVDPGDRRKAIAFAVDSGRCTFCGICVENCPSGGLYFTQDFERASLDRESLVYNLIHDGEATGEGERRD